MADLHPTVTQRVGAPASSGQVTELQNMTKIETKLILKHDTLTEKGRRHVGSKTPGEAGTHTRLEHVPS
jgi:hypothetical protein